MYVDYTTCTWILLHVHGTDSLVLFTLIYEIECDFRASMADSLVHPLL